MSLMYHLCRVARPRVLLLLCVLPLWLTANNRRGAQTPGKMNFSAAQLMKLNNHNTPACLSVIKELCLLRRPRYIHRSSRRKFVFSRSDDAIPTVWSAVRPVASLPRHQSAVTTWISSSDTGVAATAPRMDTVSKRGVNLSLLKRVQRFTTSSNIQIELFNVQSLTNKSCLIHNHIQDKCLDIMCLTETWHQPDVFSVLNETCPPGYCYLQQARSSGRGGGLAVIYRNHLTLSPLPLPELSSFECLAFNSKHPLPMTVLLIYRPPEPNPRFIPEM